MNLWQSLSGRVEVELVSADLTAAMTALGKASITVEDAVYQDPLHLRFTVERRNLRRVQRLAEKRGDMLTICHRYGLFFGLKGLLKRPVLVMGLLGILLLSLWLPTRVLFVEVEGNVTLAAEQIIEKAGACGLGFGASRQLVRSEKMKNALLAAMPQLQWAGVNTYGCRAVITVRERQQQNIEPEKSEVSSIVALRDGVVREITVLKGNALCKPGQVVKAGEVLVSGYFDCGICIRAGQSVAEIYGDTQRRLTAVFPVCYAQKSEIKASTKKYSLIIGKKRINFFKGSGISGTTCAKIYEENYLTLPGGYRLPIAIAREQWYDYDETPVTITDGERFLSKFAANYLSRQMAAGKINGVSELFFQNEQSLSLEGIYSCYEMIGLTRPEERLNE